MTVGQFRLFVAATGYRTDAEKGSPDAGHTIGAFASPETKPDDRDWSPLANWRNPFPRLRSYVLEDEHPVIQVSWNDASEYSRHFGLRLPTEAEWEYAARAGTTTPFFWGDSSEGAYGFGNFKDFAGKRRFPLWSAAFKFDDGAGLISPVGRYRPNPWKLFDMAGNVSEWVADAYGSYSQTFPDGSGRAGATSAARVIRGSSWIDQPDFSRSAKRIGFRPASRRDFIGFRVVMDAPLVSDGHL